jgi:hypothetical protein
MMTLDQIDKALADWQAKLALASDSLLDLDDQMTYKRLKGDVVSGLPPTPLTGVTQTRVPPALAAVTDLWQYLQGLQEVIKRAQELRKSISRVWANPNTLTEIEQLLKGPSIRLPSVQTPLARRGLLTQSESAASISPDQLLEAMTGTFEAARDTILAVDAAWRRLEPDLAAANQETALLQSLANSLGEGALPELTAAQQRLAALRAGVQSDPLGTDADFGREITPLLQRVRTRLEERERQRGSLAADLQAARTRIAELEEAHRQCAAALDECRLKIENPTGLRAPLADTAAPDLTAWLDTLNTTLQSGRWQSVRVGLDRWQATFEGYLAAERAALAANRAPLETRAELRGRLSSLRVKAQAYAARGAALDPELTRIAGEADGLLSRHPTPLGQAGRLVADFETRLARSLSK